MSKIKTNVIENLAGTKSISIDELLELNQNMIDFHNRKWKRYTTGERNIDITYTNTNKYPIDVSILTTGGSSSAHAANVKAVIDDAPSITVDLNYGSYASASGIVTIPPGSTYKILIHSAISLSQWNELS